ncbi:hypothetical protein UPYG_G00000530 [Umbra pygmaea]|uniref:Myosin-binding protein H n=1 Tax=Umbra pygmaea TaxID=75934 RepID=A0ABD0Y3M4_UMBPY
MSAKPDPIKKSAVKKSEAAPADTDPAAAMVEVPVEAGGQAPTGEVLTSTPQNLTVEDVQDTSVTIKWLASDTSGASGLDGYTVETCKDGAKEWVVANTEPTVANCYTIKNLTPGDLLNIRVLAIKSGGRSEPATLPQPVLIQEVIERPKIKLPRFLRTRYVRRVGEQVNIVIPFLGKPKPILCWTKDGEPLDTSRVSILFSDKDDPLHENANRRDSPEELYDLYQKLVDTWGFNAALEWTPPRDNGNTEITGYIVQKADKKTGDWFTVFDNCHRLSATVSDLIMGNSYSFRVFSQNKVGISEEATVAKGIATIQKIGIVYKPPQYTEHDFSEAPKFTASLNDRAATVGYTTKLLCAVRGSPKPKIEWLKNQMVIGDDPKFRQISNQGVCSLEIRKPCSFDGGVYTCRAKNTLGEATVACRLQVKQVITPEGEKAK